MEAPESVCNARMEEIAFLNSKFFWGNMSPDPTSRLLSFASSVYTHSNIPPHYIINFPTPMIGNVVKMSCVVSVLSLKALIVGRFFFFFDQEKCKRIV